MIDLPSGQQDNGDNTKDTCGNEVGSPITVVTSNERRGDGSTSSDVDSSIEVYNPNELHLQKKVKVLAHVDALVSQSRGDENDLS